MGRRIPVNLNPDQALAVFAVVGIVVLMAVGLGLLELILTRGAALALRLTGHRPVRKSPTRVAIDELEDRLRGGPPE